jgi:hypothetical protein
MSDLIDAANQLDVLSAPIDIPSHVGPDNSTEPPKHVAKDVIDKIRKFRNLNPPCTCPSGRDSIPVHSHTNN